MKKYSTVIFFLYFVFLLGTQDNSFLFSHKSQVAFWPIYQIKWTHENKDVPVLNLDSLVLIGQCSSYSKYIKLIKNCSVRAFLKKIRKKNCSWNKDDMTLTHSLHHVKVHGCHRDSTDSQ